MATTVMMRYMVVAVEILFMAVPETIFYIRMVRSMIVCMEVMVMIFIVWARIFVQYRLKILI